MNKEPLGLAILRYVIAIAIVVLLLLLYWSSTLVEEDLLRMRNDMDQLKNDIYVLRGEVLQRRMQGSTNTTPTIPIDTEKSLLTNDPFYETTLPKLLGKDFHPHGILETATIGKPENLHPFSGWADIATWYDMCSISLTRMQFGIYETLCPYMAVKMEERINPTTNTPEFWIFLRDDVYWQPLNPEWFSEDLHLAPQFLQRHPVTAADFKLFYDAIMNPFVQEPGAVSLRTYYNDIEEVRVVDDYTLVVRWKAGKPPGSDNKPRIKYMAKGLTGDLRPLPSHVFKYFANGKKIVEDDKDPDTYRNNTVWASNFSQHWSKNIIVSCGPWLFAGMTEEKITFTRNPEFYAPLDALTGGIEIYFKNTPENIWQEFKSNKLDLYHLQPDELGEFKQFTNSSSYQRQEQIGAAIHRLDYLARMYTYIGWNEAKPYFSTATVRRAMTMAIDRKRIVDEYLNGLGIELTGPFYPYSPNYDASIKPLPFDPDESRRLLAEEGWVDTTGTGVRTKSINGVNVPFTFTLTYFVKNPTLKSICEYISTALKDIGVTCQLNGVDTADLSSTFEDKNFDAVCLGWTLGTPPEDPRQLWYSSGAKEKGSSNAIGFSNKRADEIINALDFEYNIARRQELYHQFHKIIFEEQPYTFLYTPKAALIYRDRVQNVFIPADRQDLVPGANVGEPDTNIFWIKEH